MTVPPCLRSTRRGQDAPARGAAPLAAAASSKSHRGQVLVIFSGTFVILLLMSALVIDLAWLWNNSLRIQRTADAAALAGVVFLPNDVTSAKSTADKEATRNGYDGFPLVPGGINGVYVDPTQDLQNPRRLNVRVTAPVKTFFLGLIGMPTITISRQAHAEYVLPVPMGSPENYYGVFGDVRDATFTTTGTVLHPDERTEDFDGSSSNSWDSPTQSQAGCPAGGWSNPNNAFSNNGSYADSGTATGSCQYWRDFTITSNFRSPVVSIDGIQLVLRSFRGGSGASTNCTLDAALSWDGGANWSATRTTANLPLAETALNLGGVTDLWQPATPHTWTQGDFTDGSTRFLVRLTLNRPTGATDCGAARLARVDQIELNVNYTYSTVGTTTTTATYALRGPGTTCANGAAGCYVGTPAGGGQPLNPRGFWATMNTQGAENVNGDAFQPYYDTRTGGVALGCPTPTPKACHGPDDFYNYAIEMQPNTTGGRVYIFDPVFCKTQNSSGTGDRHFGGTAAVSSFYELYADTNNTPFVRTDDTLVASSANTFQSMAFYDSTMGGSGGSDCRQQTASYGDERDYHNSWYLLNPGGAGLTGAAGTGTTYRIHTTGTDPSDVTQQRGANGEQSFAIWATSAEAEALPATCRVLVPPSSCGYPRVYGLGAMQAFTPLEASGVAQSSTFYLAQIEPIHKTKTLEVRLWDPGDTAPLTASLQILYPDSTCGAVSGACPEVGYRIAPVTFFSDRGTTNGNANPGCTLGAPVGNWKRTTASTTGITTSTGASLGIFNGCWLTIDAVIPASYDGNSVVANDFSWWKIRYTMNGTGTSNDVTTWTADIRGNPVHLVEP